MAKFNICSVAAFLVCFSIANVAAFYELKDNGGNPCPPCAADRSYHPVCGNNEHSYANPSILNCHSQCLKTEIEIQYDGLCKADNNVLRKIDAVYGLKDNGGNPCPPCAVDRSYFPVCGNNEQSYDNPSILSCHSKCLKTEIEIQYNGLCQADNNLLRNINAVYELKDGSGNSCPPCATDRSYSPVCGNNKKTYDNLSILNCHSKCLKSDIKVQHQGECA